MVLLDVNYSLVNGFLLEYIQPKHAIFRNRLNLGWIVL